MTALVSFYKYFIQPSTSILKKLTPKGILPEGARASLTSQDKLLEILKSFPPKNKKRIWLHAASAGELEQGIPVMQEAMRRGHEVFLSYTSSSGEKSAKRFMASLNNSKFIGHSYSPVLDETLWSKALKQLNPDALILIKYEIWPDMITAAENLRIPVYLVAAPDFSESKRFSSAISRRFFSHYINKLTTIATINDKAREDFIGIISDKDKRVEVAGDPRFERVMARKKAPDSRLTKLGKGWFVCGSTWPEDEELIFSFILNNKDLFSEAGLRGVILVPHEPKEQRLAEIESKLDEMGKRHLRISKVFKLESLPSDIEIILCDKTGILMDLYSVAEIAYVGGAFGKGLHNTLEPASFSIPVLFGPNYRRFPEVQGLINHKMGFSVSTAVEIRRIYDEILEKSNLEKKNTLKELESWFEMNSCSSEKIMNLVEGDFK